MAVVLIKEMGEGREHWQSGEENKARGMAWLDQIYRQDRKGTINKFEAHKDFGKIIFIFLLSFEA